MNNNPKKNNWSFIDLIQSYKIQIPILQRDYVQGRLSDKATDIRKNFVRDLISHITKYTDKHLPLDFIYGYADEEQGKFDREVSRKNIEELLFTVSKYSSDQNFKIIYSLTDEKSLNKDLFIPLDGQQRLTTLFLLHFYVALKVQPDALLKLKGRMTYKTRKSSDEFCSSLLENAGKLSLKDPISKSIQDASWFLLNWKKDPTVEGMLVMLQEIEDHFNDAKEKKEDWLKCAFEQLFVEPKITFDFLDMNEAGISDDLYLKMNSTGRPLSNYDNFKAWFVPKVESLLNQSNTLKEKAWFNPSNGNSWKIKLDQQWYNAFWMANPMKADDNIFSFIKSILSFNILLKTAREEEAKADFDKMNSKDYLSLSYFEEHGLINDFNIELLFTLFEELSATENEYLSKIDKVWNKTFSSEIQFKTLLLKGAEGLSNISLLHRTYVFAVFLLLLKKKTMSIEHFETWLRIFRNIIYNTRIDDFSRIINPVQLLHKFIYTEGIEHKEINSEKWISFFDENQVKEEYYKQGLFANGENFYDLVDAENHHYLNGQIDFLIKWAGGYDDFDLTKFKLLKSRLFNLFSEQYLMPNELVIQTTLLCFNYTWMPPKGSGRFSFCKNAYGLARDRDENWRIVFKKENSEILDLLENYECTTDSLKEIIQSKGCELEDWSRYIIEDPTIILTCGERLLNRDKEGNFVRLLSKTKLNGKHYELRTWALYRRLKKEFTHLKEEELQYYPVATVDDYCRIGFDEANVYIRFNENNFSFDFEEYDYESESYNPLEKEAVILSSDILNYIDSFDLLIV